MRLPIRILVKDSPLPKHLHVLDLLLEHKGDLSWCVNGEWYCDLLQMNSHGSANHWLQECFLEILLSE